MATAIVAAAALTTTVALAATDPGTRCERCFEQRLDRALGRRAVACEARSNDDLLDRVQRRLRRCLRRRACKAAGRREVTRTQVTAAVQRALCDATGNDPSPAEPVVVDGLVGEAPPAVEPSSGATFEEVAAHCATLVEYDDSDAPPLMALPASAELPDWCDEQAAYDDLVARCGTPRVVVVAATATGDGANGSPASPYPSIGAALAACAGPCHVLVASGSYAVGMVSVPRCTVIEGGVDVAGGVVTPGAPRPHVVGTIDAAGDAIVLARLDVEDGYGALVVDGDVLVSDSVLRGRYEAGSSAWTATGPRICASHLAANYSGFDLAWHSRRLWVAGSAVGTCYEGLALSWGSSDLRVVDSIVYGDYDALGTSWGSVGVTAHGNQLGGSYSVVDIHIAPDEDDVFPARFDVEVTGNRIHGLGCGESVGDDSVPPCLPPSDPSRGIVVEDNVFE
jgi:hypothetical protein